MIVDNRRIPIREVAEDIGLAFGSSQVAATKIVPKLLNFEQKLRRMDVAQELLNIVNHDSDSPKES